MKRLILVSTLCVMLLVACDTAEDSPLQCDITPTFTSIRDVYFKRSCVFSGCHDAASREGGMNLQTGDVHSEIVGAAAEDDKALSRGKVRVVAGQPDVSFLLQKVTGTMETDEGVLMPEGADEPVAPDCGIAQLREWIENGALDD